MVAAVIKFLDAIRKNFATAISMVGTTALSARTMGMHISANFVVGLVVVNAAGVLYTGLPGGGAGGGGGDRRKGDVAAPAAAPASKAAEPAAERERESLLDVEQGGGGLAARAGAKVAAQPHP